MTHTKATTLPPPPPIQLPEEGEAYRRGWTRIHCGWFTPNQLLAVNSGKRASFVTFGSLDKTDCPLYDYDRPLPEEEALRAALRNPSYP